MRVGLELALFPLSVGFFPLPVSGPLPHRRGVARQGGPMPIQRSNVLPGPQSGRALSQIFSLSTGTPEYVPHRGMEGVEPECLLARAGAPGEVVMENAAATRADLSLPCLWGWPMQVCSS